MCDIFQACITSSDYRWTNICLHHVYYLGVEHIKCQSIVLITSYKSRDGLIIECRSRCLSFCIWHSAIFISTSPIYTASKINIILVSCYLLFAYCMRMIEFHSCVIYKHLCALIYRYSVLCYCLRYNMYSQLISHPIDIHIISLLQSIKLSIKYIYNILELYCWH